MKAVSLPTHAGVLRDLTAAIKNLIPLERQAIGIDNGVPADIPEELSTDVKAALQAGAKLAVERLRNG